MIMLPKDSAPPARTVGRRTFLTLTGAAAASTVLLPADKAFAAEVLIQPSIRQQTMQGFGGMNHSAWIGDLTPAQRETAFGNGTGQLGFTILRIPVHDDRSKWGLEVATAKRARELGAKVIASPWDPPSSMTETVDGRKRLRYDSYAAYARHLDDFVVFMRNNGVDLHAISVQNEPDIADTWTRWTASEVVRFLRENAGVISTRVIAPESFQYRKVMSDPILNDAQALANMDILGTHLYGTQLSDFPYPLFEQRGAGKELWMTEIIYPDTQSADLWPHALDVGEHIHRALLHGRFQTYLWWYIRRSYGPMREDGTVSKRGANMAHYSKWVRPWFWRVTATANPQSGVVVTAFTNGTRIVVVTVNKNASAVFLPFKVEGGTTQAFTSWITDGSRTLAPYNGGQLSNGSFSAELPKQSIRTFVIE